MVAPDALVCFTEHAQTLLDEHAARKRWRGICRRFKIERAAGIRDRLAEKVESERWAKSKRKARALAAASNKK